MNTLECLDVWHTVPDARRTKLENKSLCCVLLGVSEKSKGYRLYDPIAKKVVISRDVIFEEEKQWDWDVSYKEQILMHLEWGEEDNGTNENEAEEDGSEGDEIGGNDAEELGNTSSTTTSKDGVNPIEKRETHAPVWMRDYVTGEGLSEEENELNTTLTAPSDPLSYEEAVKSPKWKVAMDAEIRSIEKN